MTNFVKFYKLSINLLHICDTFTYIDIIIVHNYYQMITRINNKFFTLVNDQLQQSQDRKSTLDLIIKELSNQLGESNTHRVKGIYNGKYEMKLMDAVIICRFFQLSSIEELISIETTSELTTASDLLQELAA